MPQRAPDMPFAYSTERANLDAAPKHPGFAHCTLKRTTNYQKKGVWHQLGAYVARRGYQKASFSYTD